MVEGGKVLISEDKSKSTDNHSVRSLIPGYNAASRARKPTDINLCPLLNCNSKQIQYGDTSIASTGTDNPAWSPGDCQFLSKYEGKFKRNKLTMTSQVNSSILNANIVILYFRTPNEQEKPRPERSLLERRQGPTIGGKRFKTRRN